MTPTPTIDCHHHLWDLATNAYPWLTGAQHTRKLFGDYGAICRSYLLDDYLADTKSQNVVKSVHIQANWDRAKDPVGETEWLQRIADIRGFPHGIVAGALPHDPGLEAELERHCEYENVRGIRHMVNWHDADVEHRWADRGDYLTDDAWISGVRKLPNYNLSFDLGVMYNQLPDVANAIRTAPNTIVVLNHVGFPIVRRPEEMARWRTGLAAVAELPNVFVKLSGFVMFDHDWSVESLSSVIRYAIDCFGPERSMFGSNFPVDGLFSDYDSLFNAYRTIINDFSEIERKMMFHDTAMKVYRL